MDLSVQWIQQTINLKVTILGAFAQPLPPVTTRVDVGFQQSIHSMLSAAGLVATSAARLLTAGGADDPPHWSTDGRDPSQDTTTIRDPDTSPGSSAPNDPGYAHMVIARNIRCTM